MTLKSQSPVSWFAELPRAWSVTPLGFLVSTLGGSTPSKDHPEFWQGSIPWVSPKDMKRATISDSEDHVSGAALAQTSLALIPPPAVLVVVRGMILAHTVPVAITDRPVTINQDMKALLPCDRLFAPFLAYALRAAQRALLALTEESGHGTVCLRTDLWQKLPLPTPPLHEQRAIAAHLDRKTAEIDAVIAKKERLIALLQEKQQSLVNHAVETQVDRRRAKLAYYAILLPGYAFPSSGFSGDPDDTRLLRGVNVSPDGIIWEDTVYWNRGAIADYANFALAEGDLVFGMDRPKISGGIRVARVRRNDLPCLLLQRVARLRAAAGLEQDYLELILKSEAFWRHLEPDMTGVSVPHVSPEQILSFEFWLPTLSEQKLVCSRVAAELQRLDRLVDLNTQQIAKLREYRQALITSAVTGRLAIPLPESADFSATVLASEIVHRLHDKPHFGRTKLHKLIYAVQHHCDLVGIQADYARFAFGPYDDRLQKAVEAELQGRQWYQPHQPSPEDRVTYAPLAQAGSHSAHFAKMYGDKADAIAALIDRFLDLNKVKTERAMTLYAAWNDFLIAGEPVDEEKLLNEVRHNWHPSKEKHSEESWRASLEWLKANDLIPHGFGRPTRPGDGHQEGQG